MDKKLGIVRHLYGELDDRTQLRELLEDEALMEEYQALSGVKFQLDHRSRSRPDPQTLEAVMASAAQPQHPSAPSSRPDRPARPGRTGLRRVPLLWSAAAVVALLLAVGLGWPQVWMGEPASQAPLAADQDVALKKAEQAAPEAEVGGRALGEAMASRAAAPPMEAREARADLRVADASEEDVVEDVPGWDEEGEVLELYRRIELLKARSEALEWDESAIMSLDSLPTEQAAAPPGLNAASQRRARTGNQ